jgi:lysophospholipase L1-like esterase
MYRTNSAGLRGPEYARQAAPGVRRIGVVGDSVTVGWGVEEAMAYPAVLERNLRKARPESDWEVINLGMAGLSADSVMRRLEQMDDIYDFDLLVYGFSGNDIENQYYKRLGRTRGAHIALSQRAYRASQSPSYLWRVIWPKVLSLSEALNPTPGSSTVENLYNYRENEPAWNEFERALDRFGEGSVGVGRCGVVLIHTHLVELGWLHPFSPVYEKVGTAAEGRGMTVVYTLESFRGRYEPGLWVGPFDPHPNAEGHAIFAENLSTGILQLPDSCWLESPDRARRRAQLRQSRARRQK